LIADDAHAKSKLPLWIELAKQAPDIFWRTRQKLLQNLAKTATRRGGSLTR
jgi:hypothetical protein